MVKGPGRGTGRNAVSLNGLGRGLFCFGPAFFLCAEGFAANTDRHGLAVTIFAQAALNRAVFFGHIIALGKQTAFYAFDAIGTSGADIIFFSGLKTGYPKTFFAVSLIRQDRFQSRLVLTNRSGRRGNPYRRY